MKTQSLVCLWNLTQQHPGTSGARAAAGVLLSLYNGQRFPMDLTDLRALDASNLAAAIDVIAADAGHCRMEVHAWLNTMTGRDDFGARFEHLAHEYKCFRRGRCSKEYLQGHPIDPPRVVFRLPEPQADLPKAA